MKKITVADLHEKNFDEYSILRFLKYEHDKIDWDKVTEIHFDEYCYHLESYFNYLTESFNLNITFYLSNHFEKYENGKLVYLREYKKDEDSALIKKYNKKGQKIYEKFLSSERIWDYDTEDRLIYYKEINLREKISKMYEYDDSGNCILEDVKHNENTFNCIRKYDKNNNLIFIKEEENGIIESKQYIYNKNNNLIKKIEVNNRGDECIFIYEYENNVLKNIKSNMDISIYDNIRYV